ncbi:GtrA family protein [Geodermatophilus sp. TF02-6]|uniref:GtrA family protein n=1 Tax=Geodermatophilus sp. TF02-6 TaxID=2250575 RepID=UPI0013145F8B|nr:GtrA family protein [Geodermatophilus sp. TF02-6]
MHQATRFLLGSCLGLAVDLGVFALGVRLGASPGAANVLSAACAVVVVYLFVTRYAFAAERSRTSFLLFVAWYVVSIVVFSVLIEVLHDRTGWAPLVCKSLSLPPSFAANFLASKLLFRRRPAAAAAPRPVRDPAGA